MKIIVCSLTSNENTAFQTQKNVDECVFIYRTYHIVSRGGLQFYLSEIGRQLVKAPLAAAISPYLISPTHPKHKLSCKTFTYPLQNTDWGEWCPLSL